VECTSACITALLAFARQHPHHRASDIARAVAKAEAFIRRIQRPDGSWWVLWGRGGWAGAAGRSGGTALGQAGAGAGAARRLPSAASTPAARRALPTRLAR
jgi:hypothetical protein